MTKERAQVLAFKMMNKHKGDKESAIEDLETLHDSFFIYGQLKKAEMIRQVIQAVRREY